MRTHRASTETGISAQLKTISTAERTRRHIGNRRRPGRGFGVSAAGAVVVTPHPRTGACERVHPDWMNSSTAGSAGDQDLGHLDAVERGALAEVVAGDPQVRASPAPTGPRAAGRRAPGRCRRPRAGSGSRRRRRRARTPGASRSSSTASALLIGRWKRTFTDTAWPTNTGTRTHVTVALDLVVVEDLAASRAPSSTPPTCSPLPSPNPRAGSRCRRSASTRPRPRRRAVERARARAVRRCGPRAWSTARRARAARPAPRPTPTGTSTRPCGRCARRGAAARAR